MKKERTGVVVLVLILIIVVLAGVVLYTLAIRPAITSYVIRNQNQGYAVAIAQVMQQAVTCEPVPLTFGNQTINLVAIECPVIQQCLRQTQ